MKWNGDFWWRSYDDLTLKAFAKQLEYKYAFSERQIKQGPFGEYYTTGGLRWSIINNGGSYMSLTSELTQSVFNDFLEQMVRVSAEGGRKLIALMGSAAMARLQTILGDYIKYAGTANTLGGTSVTGLNVMKYAYAGLEIEFVRWALLDDEMFRGELSSVNGKPRMSNSIYFIDMTAIPAADGSGTIAAMQKSCMVAPCPIPCPVQSKLLVGLMPSSAVLVFPAEPLRIGAVMGCRTPAAWRLKRRRMGR